jgi:hypothetical protein
MRPTKSLTSHKTVTSLKDAPLSDFSRITKNILIFRENNVSGVKMCHFKKSNIRLSENIKREERLQMGRGAKFEFTKFELLCCNKDNKDYKVRTYFRASQL